MTRFGLVDLSQCYIQALNKLFLCIIFAISVSMHGIAQPAPVMTALSTGSEVAMWSIAADKPTHKTPIVFLHGGPGMYTEARRFEEGAPFRAAGFNTVYFDQAGGGQSKRLKASDYSFERAVADLEAFRTRLGYDHLVLWGNSYGASLAAVYAARYPATVSGLLLTSPGTFPGTEPKRNYGLTNRGKLHLGKAMSAALSKVDSKGAAAEADISQADAGTLLDDTASAELMEAMVCKGAKVTPPALARGANLFANRIILKDVQKLKFKPAVSTAIPTLIIRGACDFLPEANAERYRAQFSGTIATIKQTGHGLLENRADVDAAVGAFALVALGKVE